MQKPIMLDIPVPCQEAWDAMTPSDKGRFCSSCAKQVVDFTLMSDSEIINYFLTKSGNTCGRFAGDQLKRALIPVKKEPAKKWWIALLFPAILSTAKTNAQKKKPFALNEKPALIRIEPVTIIKGDGETGSAFCSNTITTVKKEATPNPDAVTGDTVIVTNPFKKLIIMGSIVDAGNNQPLANASIILKGRSIGTISDANGNFSLTITDYDNHSALVISFIGYETKEIPIEAAAAVPTTKDEAVITLNPQLTYMNTMLTGEVVVVGYVIQHTPMVKKDTMYTAVKKFFRSSVYKVYPNPVNSGSAVQVEFFKKGAYSIHIMDNNAALVAEQKFTATTDGAITTVMIPAALSAGMYYVQISDERKKKYGTTKIFIR